MRIAVLALVVGYFFLPYDIRTWIPVWLPFLRRARARDRLLRRRLAEGPARRGRAVAAASAGRSRATWPTRRPLVAGGAHGRARRRADPRAGDRRHGGGATSAACRRPDEPSPLRRRSAGRAGSAAAGPPTRSRRAPPSRSSPGSSSTPRARTAGARSRRRIGPAPRRCSPARRRKIAGHPAQRHAATAAAASSASYRTRTAWRSSAAARAYLTPAICDRLYQLAFKHRVQSFPGTGRAIAVLAHESWHLRGVANEGLANCYAFQSGVRLGVDLGLSEGRPGR